MKNISIEFKKYSENISEELLQEKLEALEMIIVFFDVKKSNQQKEIIDAKKKQMLNYLLKDYYNLLLIQSEENQERFQLYKDKVSDFLKDQIKFQDITANIEKEFPLEFNNKKQVVRQLMSDLNVSLPNNYAIKLMFGEILVDEANLNNLIRSKINPESVKELMQAWMIFQINRYIGLDNAFLTTDVETTKAKEFFKKALNYEVIVKERLSKHVGYEHFWDALNSLNKEVGLNKPAQKKLLEVFTNELHGKSDNLFVQKDNVFYFNSSNVNNVLKEGFTKERKTELIKLYLFSQFFEKIKHPDFLSESMFTVSQYAPQVKQKLFAQVSKHFVSSVFDELKPYFSKVNLNIVNYELGCNAADTMLLKEKNNIIFNLELANKKLQQDNISEEDKYQFSVLYILSQLLNTKSCQMKIFNKDEQMHEEMKLINLNNTVVFQDQQYLKVISGLNNNKLLNVIHTFFKDIVLDDKSQEDLHNNVLLKVLKMNVLQTGKNKDKLLIVSKNLVLFNEENILSQQHDVLLKTYVYAKFFKDNKDYHSIQDSSVTNIDNHISYIIEQLKNKVSEKDIYLKIKEIEKELEIEPKEVYQQFNETSVELDAKNDLTFMKNDMLIFKHEKKSSISTAFVRIEVIDKLLNKTIDSYNVKELVKLCLFSKLNEVKQGVLRNKNNHLIILNENVEILKEKIPAIIEKISGKVLEEEINMAITEINENMPFDGNDDYIKRNVVYDIKKQVGIKVKSPFKHLL